MGPRGPLNALPVCYMRNGAMHCRMSFRGKHFSCTVGRIPTDVHLAGRQARRPGPPEDAALS